MAKSDVMIGIGPKFQNEWSVVAQLDKRFYYEILSEKFIGLNWTWYHISDLIKDFDKKLRNASNIFKTVSYRS